MTITEDDRILLINHRLQKTDELVVEIRLHIENGHYNTAVNRIYYGMFYMVSALALMKGFTTSKHFQLIGWFNKTFVKEGLVDKKFGRILNTAFEMRTKGDYDDFIHYKQNDVVTLYNEMLEFINIIKIIISKKIE